MPTGKKIDDEDKNVREMVDLLISITLNEFLELMVTITFFISFLMCFYGPNAELMGNIKSSYFQNIPVTDIDLFIENVAMFLGVELITIFVSVISLWMTCRINMFRAYLALQKEFWVMMTVYLAYTIYLVSFRTLLRSKIKGWDQSKIISSQFNSYLFQYFNVSLISNAIDMTFEFEWLDQNSNKTSNNINNYLNTTSNSTLDLLRK